MKKNKKPIPVSWLAGILFIVSFFLYANTLAFDFVWDDHHLISDNPQMESWLSLKDFFTKDLWENSTVNYKSGFYRPVTLSAFLMVSKMGGGSPFGFHLFNVLIHGINGLLVFFLIFKLTKQARTSFLAGLLFAIHPLQTETVAFISDLGDLLCVLFLLLSLYGYLRFVENKERKALWVSVGSLILALLSKENAMVGWFLILLMDYVFISKWKFPQFRRRIKYHCIFLGVTCLYILWRVFILGTLNAVTTLENVRYVSVLPSFGIGSHVLTTMKILLLYAQLFFVPIKQSISYVVLPTGDLWSWESTISLVFCVCLIKLTVIAFWKKNAWAFFALVWFWATLLPLTNLIPISNTIAERFMYLPSVGLCVLIVFACQMAFDKYMKTPLQKQIFLACGILLFSFLTIKTSTRTLDWKSNYSLFLSAREEQPCSPIAHINLSIYYQRNGLYQKAFDENQLYEQCRAQIQQEYARLKNIQIRK